MTNFIKREGLEDTPEILSVTATHRVEYSKAISLKRIADALEKLTNSHTENIIDELHNRVDVKS